MPPLPTATLLFQHPPNGNRIARRPLRSFLIDTARRITGDRAITCLITDDRHLESLNRQFRSKNAPTDVLSFPWENGGGEIAISLDTAARQAAEFGHGLEQELRILILHGLLHLAGMDHETDSGEMARAEMKWRKRLGLAPGLIERSR